MKCEVTEVITITRLNDVIGDHIVKRKDEIRGIGILIDTRFTFGGHIEYITTKARHLTVYIWSISI